MSQITAYLTFDGTCAEAMRFYERALDAKLQMMMTHAESPMADQAPPGSADRIMHARLALGSGGVLMASDTLPGMPYNGISGVSLALAYENEAEAKQRFDALADGGQITMPLQKTFWAPLFGMLVDRFGVPWMVNGGHLQV